MISSAQRIVQIKDILFKEGQVEVSDLSELFHVSGLTIRRDLEKMEKEGLVIRKYGGAQLNERYTHLINRKQNNIEFVEEEIAKTVAKMLEPNDSVYIGGGRISVALVKELQYINPLHVVTNDLKIAVEMKNNPVNRTSVLGGYLDYTNDLMLGPQVISSLKQIHIRKCVVELKYADLNTGYMVNSYEEAEFINALLSISSTAVLVIASKSFDKNGMVRLGDLKMFDTVITDSDIGDEYKEYYFSNDVRLFTSVNID